MRNTMWQRQGKQEWWREGSQDGLLQNGAISEQQLGAKKLHYRKRNDKKEELLKQKNEREAVTEREKKHKSCELPPSVCAHGSGYNLAPKRHCNVTMLSSAQSLLIDGKVLLRWHSCARIGSVCVRWKQKKNPKLNQGSERYIYIYIYLKEG